jgi:L-asparagine transporter-like permease
MFSKIRKIPLSDLLTYAFSAGVVLIWVFAPETNIMLLLGLSFLAVALNIFLYGAKRVRRKNEEIIKKADEARQRVGESDDTEQKDKYYF